MNQTPHVAVVGATGAVGMEMIKTLEKRSFPVGKLALLASARSVADGPPEPGVDIGLMRSKSGARAQSATPNPTGKPSATNPNTDAPAAPPATPAAPSSNSSRTTATSAPATASGSAHPT